jgi:hypothetical protein
MLDILWSEAKSMSIERLKKDDEMGLHTYSLASAVAELPGKAWLRQSRMESKPLQGTLRFFDGRSLSATNNKRRRDTKVASERLGFDSWQGYSMCGGNTDYVERRGRFILAGLVRRYTASQWVYTGEYTHREPL